MPATLLALAATVPVTPDAPTARRWLEDELTAGVYHQGPSLVDRILTWVLDLLSRLTGAGADVSPVLLVVIVAAVAAVVGLAVWIAGPVRLRARRLAAGAVLAGDDGRTAAEMRAAATSAAAAGDLTTAVVERFRALVRGAEERVVLDELPGRTADEAALALAGAFPAATDRVRTAARLFDDTLYGERTPQPAAYAALAALDDELLAARPVPAAARQTVPAGLA